MVIRSYLFFIALLSNAVLQTVATDPPDSEFQNRVLDEASDSSPGNDDKKVLAGLFDADSRSTFTNIISRQNGRRSGTRSSVFSISLNLPDLSAAANSPTTRTKTIFGDDELLVNYSFDCLEGNSNDQSDTFYYVCSVQQDVEGGEGKRILQKDNHYDGNPKASFGVNGPFVAGVIESESLRVQIVSNIERDNEGNMNNVTYSYVAGKPEDLFYEHVGLEAKSEEIAIDGDTRERSLLKTNDSSLQYNRKVSVVDAKNTAKDFGTMMKKRKLSNDESEIDLLIYFSKRGACQWLSQAYPCTLDSAAMTSLETSAEAWVQYMNGIVLDSGISDLTFVKVHLAIDEFYDEGTNADQQVVLDHLTDKGDGFLDNAHELRNEFSADFVVGFIYKEQCGTNCITAAGIAWVPDLQPYSDLGFSITGGPYPFLSTVGVHEVGHNLGCNHHRSQYTGNSNSPDYSFGHADCSASQCWVTVMSYRSVCDNLCSGVSWIPYFSNPDVNYNGIPTGTIGSTPNNNALQISQSKYGAAKNRYRGLRSINGNSKSYFFGSFQIFTFDVIAKQDITIVNYETAMDGGANQVELSYSLAPYNGNELNDSFWTLVANEVITPYSDLSTPSKIQPFGVFSPFSINVAAGDTISFRIKMPSGGGFLMSNPDSSLAVGDVVSENNDLSLIVGKMGALSFLYSNTATLYRNTNLVYTVADSTPTAFPSSQPSSKPSFNPSTLPTLDPSSKPSTKPSLLPSSKPSLQPSQSPSSKPSSYPTSIPTAVPSFIPSLEPSLQPSLPPSSKPSFIPTSNPSLNPSQSPSSKPSSKPSSSPTDTPSIIPSSHPSQMPSESPSSIPSTSPSTGPTQNPSSYPSLKPSLDPSTSPTDVPSFIPTSNPSLNPSESPSSEPSSKPSSSPTDIPSFIPSSHPSLKPSQSPSSNPSTSPSTGPTQNPSIHPSSKPSLDPSTSPTDIPSFVPTSNPSLNPSESPSFEPSSIPTTSPTGLPEPPSALPSSPPTSYPSISPTDIPSFIPTSNPSLNPSQSPSSEPSSKPSSSPTDTPSFIPSSEPSRMPSQSPSSNPSTTPSTGPTQNPSIHPSSKPSLDPSTSPTDTPSFIPTSNPSLNPSESPSFEPSSIPTTSPTGLPEPPSALPSSPPTSYPSISPTDIPSFIPTSNPSLNPSQSPSSHPSRLPTVVPSLNPSSHPSSKPSSDPSSTSTKTPSLIPSSEPSLVPSQFPSSGPSSSPSSTPTGLPKPPTAFPSFQPSLKPSSTPSFIPSTLPCVDAQGRVKVTINGNKENRSCKGHNKKGNCDVPDVQKACPITCKAGCGATSVPSSAPSPSDGPPCVDTEGKVKVIINGKRENRSCNGHKNNGNCNVAEVKKACCESCGKVSPTSAPSFAPSPSGGSPCVDAEGKVQVMINGNKENRSCKKHKKKGNCDVPEVEEACCDSCS